MIYNKCLPYSSPDRVGNEAEFTGAEMIFEMAILRLADVRPFQHIDDMIKALTPWKKTRTNRCRQ